ncbi:MAG: ABC transporter permease subunit [Marinoscillum sp.]
MTVLEILSEYRVMFLEGLSTTLLLCLYIYPLGLVMGTILGSIGYRYRITGLLTRAFSTLISATPILVILFWLHYPMQYILDVVIDPFYTSVFAISLVAIFLISDIIYNSLSEFPQQYVSAAKVCGISSRTILLRIQLPIIVRQVLPSIINILVVILQTTLFTSLISVNELFRVSQQINAEIYRPVEIYTALGIFYIGISLVIFGIAHFIKIKYTRNLSEN